MADRRLPDHESLVERSILVEAADWLVRLADDEHDSEEPDSNLEERNAAFMRWVSQSPEHLRAFLELYETRQRLYSIDRSYVFEISEILKQQEAGVVHLYSAANTATLKEPSPTPFRRRMISFVVASLAVVIVSSALMWTRLSTPVYSTGIGEQRTAKLDDGSFVTLNTNSQIEVNFSEHARHIQLVRGEALFVVEHDTTRPFLVHAGSAVVRAVGTQFSVRRRAESTDVSVLEGVVQVNASGEEAGPPAAAMPQSGMAVNAMPATEAEPIRLSAGEEAMVTVGHVSKSANPSVASSMAWRQRRLIFHDAPLSDIADEFNRYNKIQVIVEGAARGRRFSGIFDADHPESLVLYAAKDDSLAVQPEGDNWLIRGH